MNEATDAREFPTSSATAPPHDTGLMDGLVMAHGPPWVRVVVLGLCEEGFAWLRILEAATGFAKGRIAGPMGFPEKARHRHILSWAIDQGCLTE